MACNTLVIRSATSHVVQLVDGQHARVPINPIRLKRGNPLDVSGRTRFYDRTDPTPDVESGLTDAEFLDLVFEYMTKHPNVVNHVHVQLKVHGETEPVAPFNGYDKMPAEGIRQMLEYADHDLKGLLKYELEIRPTQVDENGDQLQVRDDVVDMLEDVAEQRAAAMLVDADMEVQGL